MMYQPMTRRDLERYLPNFDPARDPQVGEWVLLAPPRRAALVGPLLEIIAREGLQPVYPFHVGCAQTGESSSASVLTAGESTSTAQIDPRRIFPTLDEVHRNFRRRCMRSAPDAKRVNNESKYIAVTSEEVGGGEEEEEDDDTTLYLNPRALLLTPCAPAVFGGSDFIEGLDKETGRVVFLNWKTGELRTDSVALKPKPTPDWAAEVVEKGMVEWETWQRRQKNAL